MTGPHIVGGVLYGANEMVGNWVQHHLGGGEIAGDYTALGVLGPDGELTFGALWFNRRDADVEVAMFATDIRPSMPALFRRILAHPFEVLGASRVSAEIDADNERVIRFALGIGMKLEGRKRRATADGKDKLLFGLLPEDCPFLKVMNGKSPEPARANRSESLFVG